jgi:hypothetical protein
LFLLLPKPGVAGAGDLTFSEYADAAVNTLERVWYHDGTWAMCLLPQCRRTNSDWGADAFTYDLYLRWSTSKEESTKPYFDRLAETFKRFGGPCSTTACSQWSDVPAWDAVAALRTYEATGYDSAALAAAEDAFDVVERSSAYALGACPSILYQQPYGGQNKLKTLETDSNLIRAALLLYRFTGEQEYLDEAAARYASVRRYFLDPDVSLYSVYVFDDGKTCRQLPHRFFASVNGNMIEAGMQLYDATGQAEYRHDAIATAKAVDAYLSDERGVFVDEQAENDITEPLIEAMFDLASQERQSFARDWILRNAEAAVSARNADGNFSRFFDGPPPGGTVTAWQTSGGFGLMIAAAALAPDAAPALDAWHGATYVARDLFSLPATITFTGSSIALMGTIGERCCELGHARVFIDGQETFHRPGIWQNKSSADRSLGDSVLFVWRWPRAERHTLRFEAGVPNAKEGGSFLHVRGYYYK